MKSNKKTFAKYFVKRNPRTLKFLEENKKPVAGDFIRNTRITQGVADQLNANWRNTGEIWVEVKEKAPKKELTNAEKEKLAKKEKRAKLMKVAEQLVNDGKLEEMPPKNIPLEKLETKLNELQTED